MWNRGGEQVTTERIWCIEHHMKIMNSKTIVYPKSQRQFRAQI